jgi:precorrin-6A/cobalt-precorrin-6A reductase
MSARILLLAGTSEARQLAGKLAQMPKLKVTGSFAGATRAPLALDVDTRVGGFGGAEGLADYLNCSGTDIVIDATHPFATNITAHAAQACRKTGVAHVILQRPGWQAQAGDRWHFVDQLEQAAALIPGGAVVFLGTGRQSLHSFANLADHRLICRQIDPPEGVFPYPDGRFQVGRPPFSVADEIAFFKAEAIDWLVVKNSGGAASRSKLDAARALGLPVVLQRRPVLPSAEKVETVEACLSWLKKR